MDAVNELMKEVVHVVMYHLKKHLDYVISYKRYENKMRAKMESLDIARAGEKEHLDKNRRNRLVVPDEVTPWLEKVEKIKEKVENFPREGLGCLNLKNRYKLGSKALEIIKEIDSVLQQHSLIKWTDHRIPPGRIDPTMTISGDHSTEFRSREQTFRKALEALRPNHSSHMVALCGMGGVGKTTMMRKLKEAVAKERLFTDYVEAVIGEKTDPIAVQQAVADYLGINLTNTITKSARTEMLRTWFKNNSDGGKRKFLVILDDVWQSVDMEDIGLSRLPNQCVDFKVLITSRDQAVCTEMGVRLDSVLKVNVLEDAEAQRLFDQHWVPSHDDDYYEVHRIGKDIVKKCYGLPIAIKTMACTLTGKHVDTWKNALDRLENHDIKTFVNAVFETSYVNLRDEVTEGIFLLCGLFPEDFNIPTEELMWYGWGLNLFKGVGTIRQARYKLNASIERLIHTNLLIKSDDVGCVKMHDLVRAFVLGICSEHSIVNHGSNEPGWPDETDIVSASCKKISLTCKGMIEFPSDLNFPNLSILKLMHGDSQLRFPEGFYEGMGKQLQVISYYDMMTEYPMPLFSSQLASLRVLRLHGCLLEFDDHCSSIGNLLNLEVLSFAECSIESLPISIGELKKLRVLDVTGCDGLRIDYGVFKNLHSLEELYACASETISFTGDDHNNYIHEVAQRWQNISSLEFEFLKFDAQWKNLSFEKLERFHISVERSLEGGSFILEIKEEIKEHSLENSLKLVTNKSEVFESGINKLFKKTVVLWLSVDDMTELEDVGLIKSSFPPDSSPFFKLKVLFVSECAKLRYLFTPDVAKSLLKLEYLGVSNCPVMKQLIHNEDKGEETITFPKLKHLGLIELPELVELEKHGVDDKCCFSEALVGETGEWEGGSSLRSMKVTKLGKEVSETRGINKSVTTLKLPNLNSMRINGCNRLKHVFTFPTFESLIQLENLVIENCKAMKVIVEKTSMASSSSSKAPAVVKFPRLSQIVLWGLPELVGFFLGTNIEFHWPSLDTLIIKDCPRMRVFTAGGSTAPQLKYVETSFGLYSPECFLNSQVTTTTGRLHKKVLQTPCPSLDGSSSSCPAATSEEINIWSFHNLIKLDMISDKSTKKVIPSNWLLHLQKLQEIKVTYCHMVEEVFEALEAGTNSSTTGFDNKSQTTTHVKLPNLTEVELYWLPSLRHIWRSNKWTVFEFPNLTTVHIDRCEMLKHVFTSSMVGSLLQLQELQIRFCKNTEEVFVVDEDKESEGKTNEIVFHSLKSLELTYLPCLKGFCIGKVDFSFPVFDTLSIDKCPAITTFTEGNSSTPNLKEIETGFGSFDVEENINSFIKMKRDEFNRDILS